MTRSECEALIAQAKSDRDAAIARVEADYKEKVAAIRLVRSMLPEVPLPSENIGDSTPRDLIEVGPAEQIGASTHAPLTEYGVVAQAIRKAIASTRDPFTASAIADIVHRDNPEMNADRVTVSKTLIRMAKSGEITTVETGAGRRPSTYNRSGGGRATAA